MKAFYFSKQDKKLRYDDNRDIAVGTTHEVSGKLILCNNGLHASERPIDALNYAPGPILWLVDLDEAEILKSDDKCCARKRTYLAEFDATEVLRKFARHQALINIDKIKPYCSDDEFKLIVEYLETGDEDLRSAANSAAAARIATDAAARSTAAAAWFAADAAWSAARSAAADADAWFAAYTAARSAANEMLTDMIKDTTGWDI